MILAIAWTLIAILGFNVVLGIVLAIIDIRRRIRQDRECLEWWHSRGFPRLPVKHRIRIARATQALAEHFASEPEPSSQVALFAAQQRATRVCVEPPGFGESASAARESPARGTVSEASEGGGGANFLTLEEVRGRRKSWTVLGERKKGGSRVA